MDKIGVVVTVYNLEEYIEQCIRSIINQKYGNLQIVIVDDGSTDSSGAICDSLAEEDDRITVIHQANQGPIVARLNGVEQIESEYVTFVDGDDWIDENLYQDIINLGYFGKADMICFGIIRYRGPQDMYEETNVFQGGLYNTEEIDNRIIPKLFWDVERQGYGIDPSLCSKIFKKNTVLDQLRKARDLDIHYGEDIAVLYPLMLKLNSLAIIEKGYYFHRLRKNNNTPSYIADDLYFDKLFKLYKYLYKIFSENNHKEILVKQLDYFYMYSARLAKIKYGDLTFEEEYMFPFDKVSKGSRVVLYGAGRVGQTFYRQLLKLEYCQIVGWVDRDADIYNRKEITTLDSLQEMSFDSIVIAIEAKKTADLVRKYLCDIGVKETKIVTL